MEAEVPPDAVLVGEIRRLHGAIGRVVRYPSYGMN